MDNQRRTILTLTGLSALGLPFAAKTANAAESAGMDALTCINTRRSARSYTTEPVSDSDIETILHAAMMAPSAMNEQPWEFVAIRNREVLDQLAGANKYGQFVKKAPLAILVCVNQDRVRVKGMEIIDVSMAAQNLMLAAHAIGLGSVFTGIYPMEDRMKAVSEILHLPQSVIPLGLIILGHLEKPMMKTAEDRFRKDAIHWDKW